MTKDRARALWTDRWEQPISTKRIAEIDACIEVAISNGFRDAQIVLPASEIDGVRFYYTEQGFTCSSLRYGGLAISGWTDV